MTLLVAVMSTLRAWARSSSTHEGREARQRAVAHWVVAVLVTVVTVIVQTRLPDADGGEDRQSSVSIPWRAIGLVAGGLVAAVVVGVVLAVSVRAWRRRQARHSKAQQAERAVQEHIESVVARHDAVLQEFGEHLVDFLSALECPALNDPSISETERFDRARIDTDDARIAVRHGAGEEPVAAYHAAVAELEVSWRIARAHARRLGTSYLEPEVSRRLAKAADLMAVVRGGDTEHERALAYQRVRQLVGTSVRVPQLAEVAVECLVRPALTAGGLDALVRANRAMNIEPLDMHALPVRNSLEDLT
ncbi:hypothetical protein [Streptomyces sp. NPDC002215]|uniref:hypothetical protein n=1 Tax=Streptomyces sp. NPDC002215 TaxID=3154412 RepID=UPI00332C05EA